MEIARRLETTKKESSLKPLLINSGEKNEHSNDSTTRYLQRFIRSFSSDYFRHAGDVLAEEAAVLGSAIRHILMNGEHINNKNIILSLVQRLEVTADVVQADVIRKTLEIVVGHTMDDI